MHRQRKPAFINQPAHLISTYFTKTNHGEMFDIQSESNAPTKITYLCLIESIHISTYMVCATEINTIRILILLGAFKYTN
jgi:hypothetical protein